MPAAPQDVPNYAWSFEIIAPENGIVLSDGGSTVEATVDRFSSHGQQWIQFAGFNRQASQHVVLHRDARHLLKFNPDGHRPINRRDGAAAAYKKSRHDF